MDNSQSPEIAELVAALVKAQQQLAPVKKECINPFYHSHYADLASVWKAMAVFFEQGISITQSPVDAPQGHLSLETQLSHVSGQWMRSRLTMRLTKDDPQGVGSALTYARRYALGCMTGIVTEEDDDGNEASTMRQHAPAVKQASQDLTRAAWVVPFGNLKNRSLTTLADDDVNYLMRYYSGKLKEPANATSRFREEWEQAILEIQAELLARYPEPV